MSTQASLAVKLFGTDAPVAAPHTLTAGPLTAELDGGDLRHICIAGVEAIRGIAFVVRDKNWGTYAAQLDDLTIAQNAAGFSVSYRAACGDNKQRLHYRAVIKGGSDGSLSFNAEATTDTAFVTNRAGFVVLHPAGLAGQSVTVLHVDGIEEQARFPPLISPAQPLFDIRALTHDVLAGLRLTCTMTGDTFEMEDQRQWNDASFKTYVRPLALPTPYELSAGERFSQAVTLTLNGAPTARARPADRADVITVTVGDAAEAMPRVGIGLEPRYTHDALSHIDALRHLRPTFISLWFDPRGGVDKTMLRDAGQLAQRVNAELALELVLPCQDDYRSELEQLSAWLNAAGASIDALSVCPAAYLRSIQPQGPWPDLPPLDAIYRAAREIFPGVRIGGGMLSYFTELNRKRPPADSADLDFIGFTSSMIVHAADDATVTENLEALPAIIATARSFGGNKPYRVGPSAIAMRHNPYGSDVLPNPDQTRLAMARLDPRQRGLLNAAWSLGYCARLAAEGIEEIALAAPVGELGLIYHPMPWPQPWFDRQAPHAAAELVYPAFHAVAGLAKAAGLPRLQAQCSDQRKLQAVAYQTTAGPALWLANLTGEAQTVKLTGTANWQRGFTLDADSFESCAVISGFAATGRPVTADPIPLAPYAVVKLSST